MHIWSHGIFKSCFLFNRYIGGTISLSYLLSLSLSSFISTIPSGVKWAFEFTNETISFHPPPPQTPLGGLGGRGVQNFFAYSLLVYIG
jgi:hypothetical protein